MRHEKTGERAVQSLAFGCFLSKYGDDPHS